jgi:LacI family transcriptional regulator
MAKPGKAPTLNDVAELAGVSRATASRALAGYGRISASTVRVVEVAAQKLGYKPNEVARAMRAGKTKTIGLVVISDFTNAFFDRATKAIIDAAKQNGYQTLVSHTDEQVENEKIAVRTLLDKRVDGLIVVPASDTDHEHLQASQLGTTPLVLIDRRLEGQNFTSITTGDYQGSIEAVSYAYGRGHRQMGFLVAVPGLLKNTNSWPHIPISTVLDRANGFAAAIKKLKVKSKMVFCQASQESAETAVEAMLAGANPPTIIFTSNNDMLLAVLRVAGKLGITIGKKLSVVSFDDSPWTAAMSPAITVISRPVDELGSRAVSALLDQMRGDAPAGDVVMPTLLIERDSVAKLRP